MVTRMVTASVLGVGQAQQGEGHVVGEAVVRTEGVPIVWLAPKLNWLSGRARRPGAVDQDLGPGHGLLGRRSVSVSST
jgi:hypothetical protein